MKLSRFDYTFRVNRLVSIDTFRFIWIGWESLHHVPWYKRSKEPAGGSVASTVRRASPFRKSPHSGCKQGAGKGFFALWRLQIRRPCSFLYTAAEGWWSAYQQSPWLWGRMEPAGSCVLWERWCPGPFPGSILESPVWDHNLTPKSEPSQSEMCKLQTLSR